MKFALLAPIAAISAAALTVPAFAQSEGAALPTIEQVLASERRDDDRARDQYRRPAETLEFFQVSPTHTVVEYGPGGGWYTRVLAPYLAIGGQYMAINQDSDGRAFRTRAQEARSKGWTERFKSGVAEMMGGSIKAEDVMAFETDEVP
ncbi:MAG: hypothetical protein AAFQ27_10825, partial [Pseudomonadota bacterium]